MHAHTRTNIKLKRVCAAAISDAIWSYVNSFTPCKPHACGEGDSNGDCEGDDGAMVMMMLVVVMGFAMILVTVVMVITANSGDDEGDANKLP